MSESASDARVEVRLGTEADALAAARLHSGSITEGFLAALGPRFLARLYRRIVTSPDAFLLVADGHRSSGGDGTTAGFIAGALDLGALYRRFIVRDGLAATLSALPQLLHSWPQAWETLRHGTTTDATTSDSQSGAAELLAIAVDPLWRGRHVGSQLVDGFLAELDRRSVDRAQVVVGADNAPAIALYRARGFEAAATFELHRGTPSLIMRRLSGGTAP